MNAKELRIGNWVRTTPNVEDVANDDYQRSYITGNHIREIEIHELLCIGIELTEEWLKKFGFEKKEANDGIHYEIGRNWVYILESGFEFEFSPQPGSRFNLFCTWKYVHELQNLYFALTGSELILSK